MASRMIMLEKGVQKQQQEHVEELAEVCVTPWECGVFGLEKPPHEGVSRFLMHLFSIPLAVKTRILNPNRF